MPEIKSSLNEVYKKHKLTDKAKEAVLERATKTSTNQGKRFEWKPALVSISIVAIVYMLVLTFNQPTGTSDASTNLAPRDADTAVMERVEEFLSIVEDGTISQEERTNYIAKSDWALQLAFESGKSIYYNKPNMTNEEVVQINTLLTKMYDYIKKESKANENIQALKSDTSFYSFLTEIPNWNRELSSFTNVIYSSSLKEKPVFNNLFLSESWLIKIIILGIFTLVVYLFVQNIRIDRKLHFFIFHVIVLAFFVYIFIQKDYNHYGYDETSIFLSIQENNKNSITLTEPKELLAIAQFGDSRYGLARLQDESLIISKFEKKLNNKYVLKGSSIQDGDSVNIGDTSKTMTSYAMGVDSNSKIDQILIKIGMEEVMKINIDPNYATIYHIDIPQSIEGWGVEYKESDE